MQKRTASTSGVLDAPHLDDSLEPDGGLEVTARRLVADLHTPSRTRFWSDLIASATIGWTAFATTVLAAPFSTLMIGSFVLAALALYRGITFTHELSHLRRRALPGFETAWNVLFGVPLLLPSFTYAGVHPSHHNLATYGTKDDPEYLPFASSRRLLVAFSLQSALLLPLLLVVRFLVLAPAGLAWPRFHRWLEVHASSFSMNPHYRREVSAELRGSMRRWEAATLAVWSLAIAGVLRGALPARLLVAWIGVLTAISVLNTARVLGAHEYESDGRPRSRHEQLKDSIDTPGGPWTELWAPVGLRYHALHHYFPGIPYHNLGIAYDRLVKGLPASARYLDSTKASLRNSLTELYAKGRRERRGA